MSVERHPDSGLPMVEVNGVWRVLGCLPPPLGASPRAATFSQAIPRERWRECNYHAAWPAVNVDDQLLTQSCVGHAVETVFSYAWLQAGQKWKVFSPTYIYGLINHGVDHGATISEAMNAIKLFGIAEAKYVPPGMIFRSQFPPEAVANGRRHRPVDCLRVVGFDSACSALSMGFPLVTGVLIDKQFGVLDDEGVPAVPTQPVGGHAIALVGLKWSERQNDWLVLMQNSWGESFGFKDETGTGGFCYLSRQHFERIFYDTWGIGGVMSDPEDTSDDLPVAHE